MRTSIALALALICLIEGAAAAAPAKTPREAVELLIQAMVGLEPPERLDEVVDWERAGHRLEVALKNRSGAKQTQPANAAQIAKVFETLVVEEAGAEASVKVMGDVFQLRRAGKAWRVIGSPKLSEIAARQPKLPALPAPSALEGELSFYDVKLPGLPETRAWIYLPAGCEVGGEARYPLVLIGVAGTNMATGIKIAAGDRPEHLPYARAGAIVVAFDLSGPSSGEEASEEEYLGAVREFLRAEAGLSNARVALEYALEVLPVERERIYAVGHSSAATLAIQFAQRERRVKACAAYAPVCALEAHFTGEFGQWLNEAIPGFASYPRAYSPLRFAGGLRCPLFLFYAEDEDPSRLPALRTFARAIQGGEQEVLVKTVPEGGHYEPMIQVGVPQAIEWLKLGK